MMASALIRAPSGILGTSPRARSVREGVSRMASSMIAPNFTAAHKGGGDVDREEGSDATDQQGVTEEEKDDLRDGDGGEGGQVGQPGAHGEHHPHAGGCPQGVHERRDVRSYR